MTEAQAPDHDDNLRALKGGSIKALTLYVAQINKKLQDEKNAKLSREEVSVLLKLSSLKIAEVPEQIKENMPKNGNITLIKPA